MKKQPVFLALTATTIAFCLIVTSCNDDDDTPSLPTDGLVAYYPFNDNAQDESGYSNHGSLKNGVQFVSDRKGQSKSAVYFDGAEAHIVIPHSGRIDFGKNDDFTISLWVKCGDQNDKVYVDNEILTKVTGTYPYAVRVINNTFNDPAGDRGKWTGLRWDGQINSGAHVKKIDDNQFHHLVFVKQGTELRFYTDGVLDQNRTDNTIQETRNNAPLVVGRRHQDQSRNAFTGTVDDLRIYNRALNEAEIQQLFKE